MFGKLTKEYEVFKSVPHNMQVLLGTNMLYALVLPIVEIFVGAYIMRNTNSPAYVALYQLAMYVGIVCTSVVNGFLLKHFKVNILYCIGILLSGISMVGMMAIHSLGITELSVAGFVMGAASGFFWTNRYCPVRGRGTYSRSFRPSFIGNRHRYKSFLSDCDLFGYGYYSDRLFCLISREL